jgi:drug/metabolite transporter (DMT)-like permease
LRGPFCFAGPFLDGRLPPAPGLRGYAVTERSNAAGIAAMVLSAAFFVASDTCMKIAISGGLPALEVLALRGVVASAVCLGIILAMGQAAAIPQALNRWVLLRALGETIALFFFIRALTRMPQGDLVAIFQTSPLLVVIGASLFFGERIGAVRGAFLAAGFAGAMLVAQPGAASGYAAAPLALIGAVMVAGRDLAARRTPAGIPTMVAVLTTLVMVLFFSGIASVIVETPVRPSATDVALLVAAALLIIFGNFLVIFALRFADLGVLAPFYYAFTLAAGLVGFAVFGEVPNGLALAGMALIVGSGVAVVLHGRWQA